MKDKQVQNEGNPSKIKDDKEASIKEVYQETDDQITNDLQLIDKKPAKRSTLIKYAVFFILIFCLIFVFWHLKNYFENKPKFNNENVSLQIIAPEKIYNDQLYEYLIILSNNETIDIFDSKVSVHFPENFEIVETFPKPTQGDNIWDLKRINKNEQKEIKIQGKAIGHPDSTKILSAKATYMPQNFSSLFMKDASSVSTLVPTDINISITGSKIIKQSKAETYEISIINNNPVFPLNNIKIIAVYPEAYKSQGADPAESELDGYESIKHQWLISHLAPNEIHKIKINGVFADDITETLEQKFIVSAVLTDKNNTEFSQAEITKTLSLLEDKVDIRLFVNGSNENQNINLGDYLNFVINIKNLTSQKFINNKLVLRIEEGSSNVRLINWEEMIGEGNFALKRSKNISELTWDAKSKKNLSVLDKNDEIFIDFSLKTTSENLHGALLKEDRIKSQLFYTGFIKTEGEELVENNLETPKITNSFLSDFSLNNFARYYLDEATKVGEGPVPPKVNETTSYTVYWEISNNLHDLTDIKITAILPEYVKWENVFKVTSGQMVFDANSREITWTINKLPKNFEKQAANFKISITPVAGDIDQVINLIKESKISAFDAEIESEIKNTYPSLNTNLAGDPKVEGFGKVE